MANWTRNIRQDQQRFEDNIKALRVRAQFEPEGGFLRKQMEETAIISAVAIPRAKKYQLKEKGEPTQQPDGTYRLEGYIQMVGSPKALWRTTEMMREAILEQDFKEEPTMIRFAVKEIGGPLYFKEIEGKNFVAIRKWVYSHEEPPKGNYKHRYFPQWGVIIVKFPYWGEVWFSDEGGLNEKQELMLRKRYEVVTKRGLQEAVEDL